MLAQRCLPPYLAALADLPAAPAEPPVLLAQLAVAATAQAEGGPPPTAAPVAGSGAAAAAALLGAQGAAGSKLRPGPAGGATSSSSAAGSDTAAESARDARLLGACSALGSSLIMWRLIFRDPAFFTAAHYAIIASRAYTSAPAQGAITKLLLTMFGRYLHPPTEMDYAWPAYTQLCADMRQLSLPGALLGSYRYTLAATIFTLLLLPPAHHAASAPFTQHFLALLQSDMLTQRRLAVAGLWFQLTALLEHGVSNADVTAAVTQAVAAPGFGARLLAHFTADHATLDQREAGRDKRGGGSLAELQVRAVAG